MDVVYDRGDPVYIYGNGGQEIVGWTGGMDYPRITFSGEVTGENGHDAIMGYMKAAEGMPIGRLRNEWRCLWCGSVHPIEYTHCDKCGGPRGWLV